MEALSLLGWGMTLGFLIFQMIYNKYITFFVSDKKLGNYFIYLI